MPQSETTPIADDEWLLRRVASVRFRDGKSPLISPNTFEPLQPGPKVHYPDLDGISLFRAVCLQTPQDVLATMNPDRAGEFGIVRIPVSLIYSLGMTITIRPDPLILGHVTIPELNAENFARHRDQCRLFMHQLAAIASDPANILLRPTSRVS